jgi:hypothetical protein
MRGWVIDERFRTAANASVLSFLRLGNPSAHSDVAEALTLAAAGVPSVRSPDPTRYAFVALHLDDLTIVGLAFGQSGLAFRLPEDRVREAIQEGGALAVEIDSTWVRFEPWTNREPLAESRRRLARWCAVAAGTPAA